MIFTKRALQRRIEELEAAVEGSGEYARKLRDEIMELKSQNWTLENRLKEKGESIVRLNERLRVEAAEGDEARRRYFDAAELARQILAIGEKAGLV
jgi:septal ring factor EnvC (AmiA/AmiB activator)